ncbi:MAG: Rpn family recombination-promoting nuclease/putative transposase [Selenomonadaceae bacterium]|nr:Rpn family recombination-promoting nuclease/putative transposase [Selenomonadaceae bacterium]
MTKQYRDGLFRSYFSDKKRLLSLCNLLTGEDATDTEELTINTLDGIFFDGLKNDISCIFRNRFLVIIEHQSTINENMPLRILFYASELLRQYADKHRNKIYREQLLHLPEPKFFVFYNGRKKEAARRQMRLSDAFGKSACLEAVVELYNLNEGMNDDFISADEYLNDYCTFVNMTEKYFAQGMDKEHAIAAAFAYCISHGVMKEYLSDHRKELASMLAMEYDAEAAKQAWIEQGIEQGKLFMIKNMLEMKMPLKDIARVAGLTEEEVLKLLKTEQS